MDRECLGIPSSSIPGRERCGLDPCQLNSIIRRGARWSCTKRAAHGSGQLREGSDSGVQTGQDRPWIAHARHLGTQGNRERRTAQMRQLAVRITVELPLRVRVEATVRPWGFDRCYPNRQKIWYWVKLATGWMELNPLEIRASINDLHPRLSTDARIGNCCLYEPLGNMVHCTAHNPKQAAPSSGEPIMIMRTVIRMAAIRARERWITRMVPLAHFCR